MTPSLVINIWLRSRYNFKQNYREHVRAWPIFEAQGKERKERLRRVVVRSLTTDIILLERKDHPKWRQNLSAFFCIVSAIHRQGMIDHTRFGHFWKFSSLYTIGIVVLSIMNENKRMAHASYDVHIKLTLKLKKSIELCDRGKMSRFHHTFIRLTFLLSKCQHFQAILNNTYGVK